jgi:hypothetical protein
LQKEEKGNKMKVILATIALALMAVIEAQAQDLAVGDAYFQSLPDKPQPHINSHHKTEFAGKSYGHTADREFKIQVAGMVTAWTLDTIATQQGFNQDSRRIEHGGLFNGSRSTAEVMGAWAVIDLGVAVGSYEWKRHVHNKYLHLFWRVPMMSSSYIHTNAAIGDWTSKAPKQ